MRLPAAAGETPLPLGRAAAVGIVTALVAAGGAGAWWALKPGAPSCSAATADAAAGQEAQLALAHACAGKGEMDLAVRLLTRLHNGGNAEATLALAQLYDPRELSSQRTGQLPASLPVAVEFYRQACTLRRGPADTALQQLRPFAQSDAAKGDRVAQDLLARWPTCT